jgi:sulfite exporter TauE/SafE
MSAAALAIAAITGQALLLALANAAHCAGMCGAFAAHAARGGGRGLLLFLAGKTTTYVALGATAGAIGRQALVLSSSVQLWLALLAGGALAVAGLRALQVRTVLAARGTTLAGVLSPLLGNLRSPDLPGGRFTLGAVSGAIPCGVVGLAWLQALAAGSPAAAAGFMLAFGLGTWPALALAGWLLGRGSARLQLHAAGGALLLLASALTVWRAVAGFTGVDCVLCPS